MSGGTKMMLLKVLVEVVVVGRMRCGLGFDCGTRRLPLWSLG